MHAWKTLIAVQCLLLTACGNYEAGYGDGLHGNSENRWIVYGRSQYQQGYHQGEMEARSGPHLLDSSWTNISAFLHYYPDEEKSNEKKEANP